MPTRKNFLAAAAAVPLMAASPSAATAPTPTPTPSAKKVSQLATDFAARMREFDPALTDEQLRSIAAGIDQNLGVGKAVNPKGEALKNWDEPATTFEVPQ